MAEMNLFRTEAAADFATLLALWPRTVQGRLRPIGVTLFGDVFLERASGRVDVLDLVECGIRTVAETLEEFQVLLGDADWQADNLMPDVAWLLHDRGLCPKPDECIGFAPHPLLSGSIIPDHAVVLPLAAWHSVCAAMAGESAT